MARGLREHMFGGIEEPIEGGWLLMADAVLAALPEGAQPPADDFWDDIVRPNGVWDHAQVMRELADYKVLLDEVPRVYDEVTFGRFSKPNTAAGYIIDRVNERLSESYDEGYADALAERPSCPRCESDDRALVFEPCDPENGGLTAHQWHRRPAVLAALPEYEQVADWLDGFRRERVCDYRAAEGCPCDCKYPKPDGRPSTEGPGCPELRDIVSLLRGRPTYIVREPSTPKVEMDDWHPDVLAENAHARIDPPEVCPTCGSDDPKVCMGPWGRPHKHEPRHGCCSDPFHSQGEPEGATP